MKHPTRSTRRIVRVGGSGLALALVTVASLRAAGPGIPLVEAVKNADAAAVRALLKQKVDVNAVEPEGTTALHWAAHRDDAATVDLLIRAGANVQAADRYGITPLSLACTNGSVAVVDRLLKAGAKPHAAQPEGQTALMTTAPPG